MLKEESEDGKKGCRREGEKVLHFRTEAIKAQKGKHGLLIPNPAYKTNPELHIIICYVIRHMIRASGILHIICLSFLSQYNHL